MKKILILGWQSKMNHDFVLQAAELFEKNDMKVMPFVYSHWLSNENELDRELEMYKLKKLDLHEFDMVFAKSMWSWLAAQLLQEWLFNNDVRVLILWLPLRVAKELEFDKYYNNLKWDITIIQNEFDLTGSWQMLSDYFESYQSIKIVNVSWNDTHSYEDFDLYIQLLVWS